jgi:transaldolase
MGVTLSRFSFAATMRVVDRIHHDTAHTWSPAQPSIAARLPNINILVIRIPNLSNGCQAS